jgi:hypothetical protein
VLKVIIAIGQVFKEDVSLVAIRQMGQVHGLKPSHAPFETFAFQKHEDGIVRNPIISRFPKAILWWQTYLTNTPKVSVFSALRQDKTSKIITSYYISF